MATKTIVQLTELAATPDAADFLPISDSNVTKKISVSNLSAATLGITGNKTVAEGTNLVLGTTTGTQIGTASSQKLGFFGATPVDQPLETADLLDSLQELGLIKTDTGATPLNLGTGALTCGALTAGATSASSVASPGAITSSGAAGIGYATGAGGTGTVSGTGTAQTVTINKTCGSITCASAVGSTTVKTVTVTNSTVTATDVVIVCGAGGSNPYETAVYKVTAGAFTFNYLSPSGTATEAPVFNFAVIKSVTA